MTGSTRFRISDFGFRISIRNPQSAIRNLQLAALMALALCAGPLGAGEATPPAPKAPPAAEAKKDPAPPPPAAKAPEAPAETEAARRERLGKLHDAAEALYREGRLAEAQKLYAQIALEDPNFRRVASRLDAIRVKLQDDEKRARQKQVDQLLADADAHFAAGNYAAAAKACETVLALQPKNARAQRRLAEAAGELDLRRRVTSILDLSGPAAGSRELIAQAKTALGEGPEAPAEPKAAGDRPPVTRSTKELAAEAPAAAPLVPPAEAPAPQPKAAPPAAEADPQGRRLIQQAWDLAEGAKLDQDPRPMLHKALDILAPITTTSKHSERNKQTAALLRRSLMRRLAEGGQALTPEQAKKARLYQRYLEAEELFRKKSYDECAKLTAELMAEDRTFHLARSLNQEARIKAQELETAEKDLEHRMTIERRLAETDAMSVPQDLPPAVARPPIDLSRPVVRITSPELEEKLNQRVSVNLIEADLDYFLDLLFRSTGVNLIYNPEVVADKTITVHIANYPLRQLLDYIAKNHGLLFTTTEDGVLITTPDQPRLESFVIPFNYGLVDVGEAPPSGAVAGQGATAAPLPPPTTSNIETLIAALPSLIEWPQGSFTLVDRKMNLLYLRTTRDAYHEVIRMLDPIDQIPIQVLVKALFIDVRADNFESIGLKTTLNWLCGTSEAGQGWDFTKNTWYTDSTGALRPFTEYRTGKAEFPFTGERMGTEGADPAQFTWTGVFDRGTFEVILDALNRVSGTRTLAAPSVICVNNCTASISATETLVYIEDYEVDRADISGTTYGNPYYYQQQQQQQPIPGYYPGMLSSEPVITPVFAEDEYTGIVLDVAPSIGKDTRYISITLNPRYREKVDEYSFPVVLPYQSTTQTQQQNGQQGGTTASQPMTVTITRPIISERAISTKLTVADGSVVGLGGLVRHSKKRTMSKIPLLGDIPLLGWLFSNRSFKDEKSNLLIFVQIEVITPTGARYADSGRADETPVVGPRPRATGGEAAPPVVQPAPLP
ncbi:MAG: hypothetical protein FJ290_03815 [Planctomycetes bacterium]|nr:hypothetical protein [Planctomycetota bacterium]